MLTFNSIRKVANDTMLFGFAPLFRLGSNCWCTLQNTKWKNCRPSNVEPYKPTAVEHWANMVTHGIFVPASIFAFFLLFVTAPTRPHLVISLIYGTATFCLFAISTTFHWISFMEKNRKIRTVFHLSDRIAIYFYIAATYTPWLLFQQRQLTSSALKWNIVVCLWIGALAGAAWQCYFPDRHKLISTVLYVAFSIWPSVFVIPSLIEMGALYEMAAGGAIYLVGVVFFRMDGIVPMAHAVWHLCVCFGTVLHFNAIFYYLYTQQERTYPLTTE